MKKKTALRILCHSISALVLCLVFAPHFSSAQSSLPPPATTQDLSIKIANPLGTTTDLNGFILKLLDGVVLLLTPVIVLMFLYTGFLFVKAQGAAEELTAAKQSLLYTLIGAALVLGAKGFAIVIAATVSQL